ncbi:MAG: glycosyltransferase family 4 protein [Acidimicrobiia bacterium]|nr:glycosyltransferase family 4 protein [Acidimicrobiia bacterium]
MRSSTMVVVDARRLGEGSAYRGIGTYVRNLLAALVDVEGVDVAALATPATPLPPGVRRVPVRRMASGRLLTLEHSLRLPADLGRSGAAVAHSPALDPPRRSPVPWVQTVHDLIPFAVDDPELAIERRRWRRFGPRLLQAAAVVTPSRHSADDAVAALGLDAERVHVIPHGVEPQYRPEPGEPGEPGASGEPAAARPRRGAGAPYVLFVGAWGPHKGYAEAFEAVATLADAGAPHRLVVAGRQDEWMLGRVQWVLDRARRPDLVDVAGYVEDLAALYRGADALLVTSRHEGFGLPALEAMACGTPVVGFANTAIPEVVADAGRLVPDGDVGALVAALRPVLDDETVRRTLAARGLARAARFSWRRSAEAHAEVYASAQSRSVR